MRFLCLRLQSTKGLITGQRQAERARQGAQRRLRRNEDSREKHFMPAPCQGASCAAISCCSGAARAPSGPSPGRETLADSLVHLSFSGFVTNHKAAWNILIRNGSTHR